MITNCKQQYFVYLSFNSTLELINCTWSDLKLLTDQWHFKLSLNLLNQISGTATV